MEHLWVFGCWHVCWNLDTSCCILSVSEPTLLVRACNQLGQFLQHRETNLRYLALESMCTLASSEFSHEAVKTHIDTVINALKVSPSSVVCLLIRFCRLMLQWCVQFWWFLVEPGSCSSMFVFFNHLTSRKLWDLKCATELLCTFSVVIYHLIKNCLQKQVEWAWKVILSLTKTF